MDLQHNHDATGSISLAQLEEWRSTCPACARHAAGWKELVEKAAPIYKERLGHIPFYQARMGDDAFWAQYIGSGVTAARDLVDAAGRKAARAG